MAAEIRASDPRRIEVLRPTAPKVDSADIWLVVRLETLNLSEKQIGALFDLARKWSSAGNMLAGIQIDFDANTRGLDGYADFLKDFRKRLPAQYQLSVTGLLDWSANGNPEQLRDLANIVDEVVFQTYQDRETISGYQKWLRNLNELPMPFRIGLVQNGKWSEPKNLQQNPKFMGYVVFLLNPES